MQIDHSSLGSGYDRRTCWVHARVGIHPRANGGAPRFVTTMQRLTLSGSDVFGPIHTLSAPSWDGPWTAPVEQSGFVWPDDERVVCDFWPAWHAPSGTLLGTGHTAGYSNGIVDPAKPRHTAYATYRPETDTWSPARLLAVPERAGFIQSGAGCTQRVDQPNGEILLPIYYRAGQLTSTVIRCGFDGETLTYIDHGSAHSTSLGRGLYEPSLAAYHGRFFLTLRNDEAAHVSASSDGLNFTDPMPWRFDDGTELGSCNTQAHWLVLEDGLYLVYTRRGHDNDHVSRNRAPLLIAKVNGERLCLLRESEQVVIPERGAGLGNFGTCVGPDGTGFVMASEWMQNTGPARDAARTKLAERSTPEEITGWEASDHGCTICEQFGSDNTIWLAHVRA